MTVPWWRSCHRSFPLLVAVFAIIVGCRDRVTTPEAPPLPILTFETTIEQSVDLSNGVKSTLCGIRGSAPGASRLSYYFASAPSFRSPEKQISLDPEEGTFDVMTSEGCGLWHAIVAVEDSLGRTVSDSRYFLWLAMPTMELTAPAADGLFVPAGTTELDIEVVLTAPDWGELRKLVVRTGENPAEELQFDPTSEQIVLGHTVELAGPHTLFTVTAEMDVGTTAIGFVPIRWLPAAEQ